jgi:outer membrane immunogenic protein
MKHWKQVLLASTGVVALAGSANAADIALKGAPLAIPYSNWTGFYIGGNIGAGEYSPTCGPGPAIAAVGCVDEDPMALTSRDINLVAGVQGGYDFQDGYFVYGVAADWTWTNLKTQAWNNSGSLSWRSKVNWLASVRGRAGIALERNLMYLTGGLAIGSFSEETNIGEADFHSTHRDVVLGWVAGVGIEHKFTPNISGFAEYRHYAFGKNSETVQNTNKTSNYDFTHSIDTITAGMNYRF